MSCYFELGRIVRLNIDIATLASMGTTGRPLPGRHNSNSPMIFYVLDGAAGPASIEKIKAAKS